MERISATEAARKFSDLLNRVRYQGQSFEITRGNEVVALVSPPIAVQKSKLSTFGELVDHIRNGPRLEPGDAQRWASETDKIRKEMTVPEREWE